MYFGINFWSYLKHEHGYEVWEVWSVLYDEVIKYFIFWIHLLSLFLFGLPTTPPKNHPQIGQADFGGSCSAQTQPGPQIM